MRTVKLVVIGNSGVGKTSLRGQYVSGRFSTGYRATIGADFITKTLPHHSNPEESVTLQIWDTAGQERFSSLSSAFFRGADAAVLMFDVNQPESLHALERWWAEFRERAPVSDEEMEDYCCVVVGNKIDLAQQRSEGPAVTEEDAQAFVDELVPTSSRASSPVTTYSYSEPIAPEAETSNTTDSEPEPEPELVPSINVPTATTSIDIGARHHKRPSKSRSRSSQFRFTNGTMTSTHTGLTVFHTPSSSYFDVYESARSSPLPRSHSPSPARSHLRISSTDSHEPSRAPRRAVSTSTFSSAPTITPSLFTRTAAPTPPTPPVESEDEGPPAAPLPPRPERRPKVFFTSAKTGVGVPDMFAYIAQRVVTRWEWEEAVEERTLHFRESTGSTIRLGDGRRDRKRALKQLGSSCCSS
ncbi:ras-domain-containing protein [Auriscalpium vulgare]|uniref:Ras-domain-containing protein n=1 Tax=Auriscalpium vulgare TaxID=40419 RepID=A0ACB8RDF1_9AGAM|nr:ras-domain-containing protein [Auriscalpium vulgare]